MTTIDIDSGDPVGPVVRLDWPPSVALNRAGDGPAIAPANTGGDARLVDVATGNILGTPLPGNRFRVAFSDDGTLMAAAGQSAEVRVFNAADGTAFVADVKVDFGGSVGFAFTPDRRLLVVRGDGDITVLDLFGDTKLGRPVTLDAGWLFALSPDGRLAAVANAVDNEVDLIDTDTARVVQVLRPTSAGCAAI